MKILGIDFETTGTDPKKDRIIEVGMVIWDWERGIPLQMYSEFVSHPGILIPEEITSITGITDSDCSEFGVREVDVLTEMQIWQDCTDYIMAHFGNQFDKPFVEEAKKRLGWEESKGDWLDTSIDIKYPARITTRNLKYLASEHGFLNSFSHRAVFDVLTMLKVASRYDINEIIARAQEPTLVIEAVVSFNEKEAAKAHGFRWCADKKIWWKEFKKSDYEEARMEYGFITNELAERPE